MEISQICYKISYSDKALELHSIYQQIRDIRNNNCSFALLPSLWGKLKDNHTDDWLAILEILELLVQKNIKDSFYDEVNSYLELRMKESDELQKLITDGISVINS